MDDAGDIGDEGCIERIPSDLRQCPFWRRQMCPEIVVVRTTHTANSVPSKWTYWETVALYIVLGDTCLPSEFRSSDCFIVLVAFSPCTLWDTPYPSLNP